MSSVYYELVVGRESLTAKGIGDVDYHSSIGLMANRHIDHNFNA